jgi:ATP-binding cassette subfamily C (CFTR/MRP) protein 1
MTGTVRSNILFGLAYNKNWYNKVIDACALRPDFDRFPKSDMTKLGEMGS